MTETATQTAVWTPLLTEINLITRPEVKDFVKWALEAVPAYFWTIPASTSGKYHPPDCRGEGGLVHHTRKVVYFTYSLLESWGCSDWKDELIAAAILHDGYKNNEDPKVFIGKEAWAAHGVNLRDRLARQPRWAYWYGRPDMTATIDKILDLTARHMGKWGPKDYPPISREDWLLHTADMVASRKLIVIADIQYDG